MVAGIGEVVVPFKLMHLGAMFAGNFNRAIGGAGVDHDNLVGNAFYRGKRLADEFLLILGNHTNREARFTNLGGQIGPLDVAGGQFGFFVQEIIQCQRLIPVG